MPKIIKIGQCCTELFKKKVARFFIIETRCNICSVVMRPA